MKDEISISDATRIWGIHQGKVREKLNNEYWEAQFDSDHDDDIHVALAVDSGGVFGVGVAVSTSGCTIQ